MSDLMWRGAPAGEERTAAPERPPPRLLFAVLAFAAAAFALACHLVLLWIAPLDFDEAYNLQVPLNVYLNGSYQAWYEVPAPFPHQITTGPTVLLPVAAAFALAGPAHRVARLVMTVFLLGYLWQSWWLCRRLGGAAAPLLFAIATLLFVFAPYALPSSKSVLGELPGLFFFLTGVRLLDGVARRGGVGRAVAAGVALGLAALSKLILLLFAFAAALAVLLAPGRARRVAAVAGVVIGVVLPLATWQAVAFASMGADAYQQSMARAWALFRYGGSGLGWSLWQTRPSLAQHVATLAEALGEPAWLVVAGLMAMVGIAVWALRRVHLPLPAWCVALAASAVWIWWLFFSNWLWLRHLLPGYAMLTLLVPYVGWIVLGDPRLPRAARGTALGGLAIATLLLLPPRLPAQLWQGDVLLRDQEAAASAVRQIRARLEGSVFWGFGWRQAPEISFLARLPFRDLTRRQPQSAQQNYLIVSGSTLLGPPEPLEYQTAHCTHDVYRGMAAAVCRLDSDAPRTRDSTYRP